MKAFQVLINRQLILLRKLPVLVIRTTESYTMFISLKLNGLPVINSITVPVRIRQYGNSNMWAMASYRIFMFLYGV